MIRQVMPKCCGKRMSIGLETSRYVEAWCRICSDRVFVKREDVWKPQLLDD